MNIRAWITLWFISIVAIIILLASMLIYIFSADYRVEEFYQTLHNKANNTAKLLIEVDEVDINLLRKIEKDNPISLDNEETIIFNFRNEILYSTDERDVIKIDSSLLSRIRLEDEIRYRQGDFEVLGLLFKGPYDRFAVVTAATDIYGFNKLKNLRVVLLTVFAISVLAASISGWFFSGKALQPISKVVQQVDDIEITSLNLRVDEGNGKDEIALLSQTFNRMLARWKHRSTCKKILSQMLRTNFVLRLPLLPGSLKLPC